MLRATSVRLFSASFVVWAVWIVLLCAPAQSAGLVLETGATEAIPPGIIPPGIIPPGIHLAIDSIESVDVSVGTDALVAAFLEPTRADSDGARASHSLGFALGATPVTRIVALCGGPRAQTSTRIYPLEGGRAALPAACGEQMRVRVRFNDGSQLDLDVEIRGETEAGFVPPGIAVGFNPQPEPPGRPFQVTLVWTFEEAVDVLRVDVSNAVLHPPEPGEPIALSFK